METPGSKARSCPRCGALNGAEFDRCVRCAAPLGALTAGATALKAGIGWTPDASKLWGTKVLVALTAVVFAAQLASLLRSGASPLSGGSTDELMRFGALFVPKDARADAFRVMSAVFVHIGALHFLMNMMGLASTGRVVEPAVGSARFVVAYLTCGVLGFAANVGWTAIFGSPTLTAGASGAVFGTMGMTLGWLLRMRDRRWRSFLLETVFYAVVVNLLVRVNNVAHVGGLLAGVAFGFYFATHRHPKSHALANVGAVVGLLLAVASLVLAQRAAGWGAEPDAGTCPSVPAARASAGPIRLISRPRRVAPAPPQGRIDSPREVDV